MYNRKKYKLPKNVYMKTLWHIKDYYRLKEEYGSLFGRAPVQDGQPKGTTPGDPTGSLAVKSAILSDGIKAVEEGLKTIPKEYRDGVMANICFRCRYPDTAHYNTWRVYRQRFVYEVAKRLFFY